MARQPQTILIVEDDKFLVGLLAMELEHAGFKVVKAMDAVSAFQLAEDTAPNLILLDLLLPDGDGEELLKKLITGEKTKSIPIVILSNLADADIKARCMAMGCVDYIVKADYRLEQMVAKVKDICERLCEKGKE